MKFCVKDLNTGRTVEVTDLVVDTLGQGEAPMWTDLMVCEGVDIAAELAREMFGHDNIDAGTL
jgi:hypothetical protein